MFEDKNNISTKVVTYILPSESIVQLRRKKCIEYLRQVIGLDNVGEWLGRPLLK